jgi:arogenate dehydrogenase (NADP+), plant
VSARARQFFDREGCRMVEMSCEEHDQLAASTQFITHTVGRVLGEMALTPTPIDTRGFKSLLDLVDNTTHDSFDLYYGLFMYNQNATEELERLEVAFNSVKKQLLARMHEVARGQLLYASGSSTSARSTASAGMPSAQTTGSAAPQLNGNGVAPRELEGAGDEFAAVAEESGIMSSGL